MNNVPSKGLMTGPNITLPIPYAYIVTYELNDANFDYTPFLNELYGSLNWFRHMKNTWIVIRRDTLVGLNNLLLPKIHVNDRLLIMPAKGPAMGWLPNEAWGWLDTNLRKEW